MAQRKRRRDAQSGAVEPADGWCVYVLKCRGNYLYTGLTNNLEKRLLEHERGTGSKFVRSRRPFELLKVLSCITATDARKLEAELKKMKRSGKIAYLGLSIEPVC